MLDKTRNPFLTNTFIVPYRKIVTKILAGQVENAFDVETTKFIRVYTSKEMREFLFQELSMYGRDMLTAVQHFTHSDNQYVVLTYEKMCELYGPKYKLVKRRYEDTLRELVGMSIIDCKDRKANQYWYNPDYFCQMSRIRMHPTHAVMVDTVYRT